MPIVEVQFAPKGGADVKKTAKDIKDAFKAAEEAQAKAGSKNQIALTLKQARELLGSFNGDLRKTLEALSKAGVASDDIVLLMKQLSKESVEARRQILGISQGFDATSAKIKDAKKESDGFNVNLKTARTFAKSFNWDLEKTAQHLRASGASTNSIKVAMAALKVEAAAVNKETQQGSEHADEFTKNLKSGALAASLVQKALEAAKKTLGDLNELAGVDDTKTATKKSIDLETKFAKAEKTLDLKDPDQIKQFRKNVLQTSLQSNVPAESLIEIVQAAHEQKNTGADIALKNGGQGLKDLAKLFYGDFQSGDEAVGSAGALLSQAVDYGIPLEDIGQLIKLTASSEKKGSLTGKQIAGKGGVAIAALSGLRKTSGFTAIKEGQGFLQALGDIEGLGGNMDKVKVVGEDLIGKMTGKTSDDLKEMTGIDTFDKSGKLRPMIDIMKDIRGFRNAKPENEKKLYEVFREKQSRTGVLGLTRGDRIEKWEALQNTSEAEGEDVLNRGFGKRAMTTEGQLEAQRIQRQVDEFNKLEGRSKAIVGFGRLSQESQESPLISGITQGVANTLAEKGGVRGQMLGAAVLGLGVAVSNVASNDPKNPWKYQNAQGVAAHDLQKMPGAQEGNAADDKTKALINSIALEAIKSGVRLDIAGEETPMGKRGMKVEVEIKVDQDGKVSSVTSESKDTKSAAKGNTRKKTATQR